MNRIYVVTEDFKLQIRSSDDYIIEIPIDTVLNIEVFENVQAKINIIINNSHLKLNLCMSKYSSLNIQGLAIDSNLDFNSSNKESSDLRSIFSFISKKDSINQIDINMMENNSNCSFALNGVNLENNKLYFTVNGNIKKDLKNILLEENTSIINKEDGDSKIIPNLLVDSNSVVANHSAFIGKLSPNLIMFLNSRGIETTLAKKVLMLSFLLGKMELGGLEEEFKKLIDSIID